MSNNKITVSFRLFALGSVLLSTVLSKILFITYKWASANVMIGDIVEAILLRGYELMSIVNVALAITATVYAHAYFGKKTCFCTSLVSLACLAFGKVIMLVYNCIANELSSAQLISGALSYVVEILFDALLLIIAIILSYSFAKKRCTSESEDRDRVYSPVKTAIAVSGAYYFIKIADLTAVNIIPFFVKYGMPYESELMLMISDYLFYIICFPISIPIIICSFYILKKITGRLVLKKYFKA